MLAWKSHKMTTPQKEAEPFEPWIQPCLKDTVELAVTCINTFPFLLKLVCISFSVPCNSLLHRQAPGLETPWRPPAQPRVGNGWARPRWLCHSELSGERCAQAGWRGCWRPSRESVQLTGSWAKSLSRQALGSQVGS